MILFLNVYDVYDNEIIFIHTHAQAGVKCFGRQICKNSIKEKKNPDNYLSKAYVIESLILYDGSDVKL